MRRMMGLVALCFAALTAVGCESAAAQKARIAGSCASACLAHEAKDPGTCQTLCEIAMANGEAAASSASLNTAMLGMTAGFAAGAAGSSR